MTWMVTLDFGKMYPIPLGRRIGLLVVGALLPDGVRALGVGGVATAVLVEVVAVGIPAMLSQGLQLGLLPTSCLGYTTPMTPEPR